MRNTRTILLIIAFFNISMVGISQTTFRYGVETGLAFSGFPSKYTYTNVSRGDITNNTWKPLYSPLLGFTTEWSPFKHLQINAGLHYQMTGSRYYSHMDGIDNLYGGPPYTSDSWENQTFHKLCLPVSAGYKFRIWKVHPSIFIGYSGNYFLTGNFYTKHIANYTDNSRDYFYENTFNPLKSGFPIKKFTYQLFIGFSASIGQSLSFSASANLGGMFTFDEYAGSCRPHGFTNDDFIFTLAYFFSN